MHNFQVSYVCLSPGESFHLLFGALASPTNKTGLLNVWIHMPGSNWLFTLYLPALGGGREGVSAVPDFVAAMVTSAWPAVYSHRSFSPCV